MAILQTGLANAASATGYQIARSLRFNSADTAYLSRTFSTPTDQKKWTWSGWIKRSSLNSNGTILFSTGGSGGAQTYITYGGAITTGTAADGLNLFGAPSGDNINVYGNAVYRDLSAFANVVVAVDTTQATAANRVRIYVNGIEISYATSTYPTLNQVLKINSAYSHAIGATTSLDSWSYFNAYVADIRFIDGQALDPTSFGEFDANTGVWSPITYSGTYGTNGFWLKLDDNSNNTAATLGKDSSGNSNNWTPNNFSVTAGVGNDSLVDSPTNYGTDTGVGGEVRGNYATWNLLANGGLTLANGALDASAASSAWRSVIGTMARSTGKFYYEVTVTATTATNYMIVGAGRASLPPSALNAEPGSTADGWGVQFGSPSWKINNGSYTNLGTAYSYTTNDVLMVAVDVDAGKFWVGKNGTWLVSGDPATGANALFTNLTGEIIPMIGVYASGNTGSANFGQRPFAYTAPSGFKALTTTNLPTPAIGATSTTLANKNFDVNIWTGTGTTAQNITNSGAFQPDLVWIKGRSGAYWHELFDPIRGVNKPLFSNVTNAEANYTSMTAFLSNGFTVQDNGTTNQGTNAPGATFVGWQWKGGGTAVTNTAGSISSQVSANPTAGISIVTWTGNGVSTATVGHGLGVVPAMIICKERTGTDYWHVKHKNLTSTNNLFLNTDGSELSAATVGDGVLGDLNSSTTFGFATAGSPGNVVAVNENGITNVAYCFAEIAGFSKFSSYVGNGSADGTFVYCGFRPRYIMIKGTNTNHWSVKDTARSPSNVALANLFPNLSNAESSEYDYDILSNGFKIRTTSGTVNTSGQAYIFAAFAEAPFNYARAR